ncbi:hypothetical protein DAEQUDRAFT_733940 [Daedalea quercina L-15889]|uniref:Uncharacterized protein n=1 Tax=Daedalea quercina L-15889 TaxID=1314783 RepID=A0A165KMM8_9APHY|nr:hypothetical protein DAEQUDRAFT_733940 [Daedalea quercina L-15889]
MAADFLRLIGEPLINGKNQFTGNSFTTLTRTNSPRLSMPLTAEGSVGVLYALGLQAGNLTVYHSQISVQRHPYATDQQPQRKRHFCWIPASS